MKSNRFAFVIISLSVALSLNAERTSPYTGSRIFWDTSTRKTVFESGGYARIIQLKDGRLMATCESSGIVVAFSRNMGNSWTAPQKIVNNINNIPNCVPDLIQLSDGTIIVAYNPRPSKPYTDDRKFGIRCKRSIDNGATWSEEIFVNDASYTFDDGCWEPSMLELPSGELQLYFADEGPYTNSNEQQISMCRSFDQGRTWSKVQKISFRAGFRDGMPVPILLKDRSSIVVAIEDNGWTGIHDFFPTTVRCFLDNNWTNNWIDANSSYRNKTLDLNFCPIATGGAPYLRVLPWGETVLSYQSNYNHGSLLNMLVAVGDDRAQDFKALSNPFVIGTQEECLWNSLAVVDTGIVIAVGGINGKIEMIKGYPTKLLQAPYAKPKIDGIQTHKEGYYKPNATQIILGNTNGVRFTGDFAYDKDSLYFTSRVSDHTQYASGNQIDGVRLLIDVDNVSSNTPTKGMYSFFFRLDGIVQSWQGNDGVWKQENLHINYKVVPNNSKTYYVVETAIPWRDLGKMTPPVLQRMAATIELQDRRSNTMLTDKMPDANRNQSCTWMEFQLRQPEKTGISETYRDNSVSVTVTDHRFIIKSEVPLKFVSLYSIDGKMQKNFNQSGYYLTGVVPFKGVSFMKIKLIDGRVIYKKILL